MSPGWDGTGWDGGSLPLPGGVPYLARRGWRVMSSVHQRCWWPRTRTCPGRSPRCSLSAGHLWGQGWDLSHDGQHRMGTGLTSTPLPHPYFPLKWLHGHSITECHSQGHGRRQRPLQPPVDQQAIPDLQVVAVSPGPPPTPGQLPVSGG